MFIAEGTSDSARLICGKPVSRSKNVKKSGTLFITAPEWRNTEDTNMGMTFDTGGGGGDYKRLESGTYAAVCNLLADIGLQPGSVKFPTPKHMVVIRFEVPSERLEYEIDGVKKEGPMTIYGRYTASMNEKANLRKLLESWRGKKFTDDEARNFDIAKLLGVPCLLTVTESTGNDGKTYSNIGNCSPLVKGMEVPKAENELLLYTADNHDQFDKLPKWIQDKIDTKVISDEEYDKRADAKPSVVEDDDIPF